MKLTREWDKRIKIWIDELYTDFYTPLQKLPAEGFFTFKRLSFEKALTGPYIPQKPGDKWGEMWQYGWFRMKAVIPAEAEGKRVVFKDGVGGEMLIWINGEAAGSIDLGHSELTIAQEAKAGDEYDIVIESYAGHGPRPEGAGPRMYSTGSETSSEGLQCQIKGCEIGIWNEDAFQLYMDVFTLDKLYSVLDKNSLRAQKIREGLEKFTYIVDYEVPPEQRNEMYVKARKLLKPLLDCKNGTTAPEFTIFGQSHLDLEWKWTWNETRRKCARTISTQLALMDEYKDYKFLLCNPIIVDTIRKEYPELYKRLVLKIRNKQMIAEGGTYIESDTNIPSGESLIRHFIKGKRWFKEELDVDTKMLWLPDCFGFSGQLPQIMKGCGIKYFATQKISRALEGCEKFPYNIFYWEGIDQSTVLAHFFKKNNSRYNPEQLVNRWNEDREQHSNIDSFIFPFGYGDGGGGATREMLEGVARTHDLEGAPRTIQQSPTDFFEKIEQEGCVDNRYVGEIYLAWHRGTYTAQAKLKRGNRKAEIAIRDAEIWGCVAGVQNMHEAFEDIWNKLLFNQFHDILPGTSIGPVCERAEAEFKEIAECADATSEYALKSMCNEDENSLTIWNSLSWTRNVTVLLPAGWNGACDCGLKLQPQRTPEGMYVQVRVPGCGCKTIQRNEENDEFNGIRIEKETQSEARNNAVYVIENNLIIAGFDKNGFLVSYVDKETGFEFIDGRANHFEMYKDVNVDYDAWEISSFYRDLPVELEDEAEIEATYAGDIVNEIRITRKLNESTLTQRIRLEAGSRRIDFITSVDWAETHKLLKVAFPTILHANEAIEEIQFGYVKRPTHGSRRYDADRFEVCNHKYTALSEGNKTFAVLNDCKYGVSTNGNSIELTLLRAPIVPDATADKGLQEFTYSVAAYPNGFTASNVVQDGYELNMPPRFSKGGIWDNEHSFISISEKNIILEAVKAAEDGTGDIILRIYEAMNCHTEAKLHVNMSVSRVLVTDMLETAVIDIPQAEKCNGGINVVLRFKPFEIKTVRISRENVE